MNKAASQDRLAKYTTTAAAGSNSTSQQRKVVSKRFGTGVSGGVSHSSNYCKGTVAS